MEKQEKQDLINLKKKLGELNANKSFPREEYLRKIATGEIQGAMTGYPSQDMPWLRYYVPNAFEYANNFPTNQTVWDVIKSKLEEYYDVPALEYFGRKISSDEFIEKVDMWARTFRALGVEKGEVVPIYGPFFPEIGEMTFALNAIGATVYFLKLAIGPDALAEETMNSKIAVVYDGMFKNVGYEFSKDRFKNVIIASSTDDMPSPKKEIVSFISKVKTKKQSLGIPDESKYITVVDALKMAKYYTGSYKFDFEPNQSAFITSSSGTTGKVVKGTVATNESTISQLYMCTASEFQYNKGGRCLNNLPPTASTSLNALYFLPLFSGVTVVMDPRISQNDFYNQIIKLKPNISITTGSLWETFFNRIEEEMAAGKKFDFSHSTGWVVGGEGTDPKKLNRWNDIMYKNGAPFGMCSGYGSSELFSSVSSDTHRAVGLDDKNKAITAVGVPMAGLTCGIFDENGKELKYGKRGELYVKSSSAMKEYYNKPELTSKVKVDGWIHTNDMAEIDENGFLYIWGRKNECFESVDGTKLYPFDIAGIAMEHDAIRDAIILAVNTGIPNSFTVHLAFNDGYSESDKLSIMSDIIKNLKTKLPDDFNIVGCKEYGKMLPYSPTTFKKDREFMGKQTDGYINVIDNNLVSVNLSLKNDCTYDVNYDIIESNKVKVKR